METPDIVIPPKYCHIRLTPPNGGAVSLDDFKYPCLAYFEETKKDGTKCPLHYHIAVANMDPSNLRKYCREYFKLPAVGRGQGNKYISVKGDWLDISYVAKSGNRVRADLPDIDPDWLEQEGKKYYQKKLEEKPLAITSEGVKEKKEDKPAEWDILLSKWTQLKREHFTMLDIKNWIKSYYLTRMKPIPRAGDLSRYAYSLYAISKDKTGEDDILTLDGIAETLKI